MEFKNSFYKKSVLIIVLVLILFSGILTFISYRFIDGAIKDDVAMEFTSYERYVKTFISEIEKNVSSASNAYDIKSYLHNENDRDVLGFFDYYLKSENAPSSIYILNSENKCVLSIGEDNKINEAIKFVADNGNNENVYMSDFFLDKYNNQEYVFMGKNIPLENSYANLVFCYSDEIFKNFTVNDNDEKVFMILLSNGDVVSEYDNQSENKIISDMDFLDLSKTIKNKLSKDSFVNEESGQFSLSGEDAQIAVDFKAISDPNLVLVSIEKDDCLLSKSMASMLLFALIFTTLIVLLYMRRLSKFVIKIRKSYDEIERITLTINDIDFTKTDVEVVDRYIDKIAELCSTHKKILFDFKRIAILFNTNVGIFEIFGKEGIVVYSPSIADFIGSNVAIKDDEIGKMSVEDFFRFRNLNWKKVKEEEDVYYIETSGNKRWIKIYYYDENNTKGIIFDISAYMLQKYKNILNSEFDYLTGFLQKNTFEERVSDYINNNKLSFGCLASVELNYYPVIYETYGEYIADEYLRKATSYFSNFFDGFFAGIKNKGEFVFFIYSENSKDAVKIRLEDWENKTSQNSFIAPDGKKFKIKFSVGYACYPTDSDDFDTLLKYSVFALYETKKIYKEPIHSFALENYSRNKFLEIRIKALDKLIDENDAIYNFQPIVSVFDGSIYGYEALLRTNGDVFSTPVEIINLALSEGKAYLVEKMNILNCMKIIGENRPVFDNRKLFVNSIATNSLTEEDLRGIKNEFSSVRHLIVYELSTMFADNSTVINKCQTFNRIGVKYAIDKFGGKYTDDESLLVNGAEFVKIDRSLIIDIHLKKEKQSHVMRIIKFAKENNLSVIAVGVETYDELYTVIKLGVDFVQGFYISLPKSFFLDEIRDGLKKEIEEIKSKTLVL